MKVPARESCGRRIRQTFGLFVQGAGRARRVLRAVFLAGLLAPVLALLLAAVITPLPLELAASIPSSTGVVLRDRHGVVLRELRADDGVRARWVSLADLGEQFPRALLAAEDRRFACHPGIDPLAMLRAAGQGIVHGRVISGGSTLTQQLARTLVPRPRTLRGKFAEAALALRIEASLGKRDILEQYVNRVSFGPGLRGVEAASWWYFDKPTRALSLAEAAALAGIPRGPAVYDPRKGTTRLQRRRNRVLDRMLDAGLAPQEEVSRAKAEPLVLAPTGSGQGAPHLVRALMAGDLDPALGPLRGKTRELTLTLDRNLQHEVELLAHETVQTLAPKHVSAASVVVLDNASAEILAYVGSPDIEDVARQGHNDGVLARRQPGSALKPFVYELAMERLGWTAASVLPDVELFLPTQDGFFQPHNYDGKTHGPVRLREALANSYNIPAVWTADAVSPSRLLARLRALGMTSLQENADHYGTALALGDGEVRLLELASAYATLARGGILRPVVAVKAAIGKDGRALALPPRDDRRILDDASAFVITDILADKTARIASFGEGNVLELPFPVAAKTGTSKGFRDNLAVGFTPDVTVAVWVGNFDGSPMAGVSGVTGAGPLFHAAMLAATRGRAVRPFERPPGLEDAEVCTLSGARPTASCPHRRSELFAVVSGQSSLPLAACTMHERVRVDRRDGLRAGRDCTSSDVEERVFEHFDARFTAWARSAGRPTAPDAWSPRCGTGETPRTGRGTLRVAFPPDGATFAIDPGTRSQQAIVLKAEVPDGLANVRFVIDGHPHPMQPPFRRRWTLTPGYHRFRVEADGQDADEVGFEVE